MFTVERSNPRTWTVGQLLTIGKWLPVHDFPTRIEANKHANKLNREAKVPRIHILNEENQLTLFDKQDSL